MLDYLFYITVRFLTFFICLLPIKFSLFLGRCIGTVFYYLLSGRAKTGYLNLKLALGDRIPPDGRKRIIKELFRNLTMNFVEFLYFPRIDKQYVSKYIKIIGEEKISKVLERGKGLIFLTAHFGNWELSSLIAQVKGYPMVVLARQQKLPRLNSLLNQYRARLGATVIMRGSQMRELLRSLEDNKIIGILGDQKSGKSGILVDFFNRLAWTPTGAITLARHIGAAILPVFIIREQGPFHRIEIRDELLIDKDGYRTLREFNQLLEKYIWQYPSQWLWFHRRWKGSPNKNVLILSDGKAGHLNQARAVVKIIKGLVEEKFSDLDIKGNLVEVREIEVEFKNIFTKLLLNILGIFARDSCRGCLRCLGVCLQKNNYKNLNSFYVDIIVSCGTKLAPVNLFLSKENGAKSVTVMKPGLMSIKRFNLVILPFHERVRRLKNTVITQIAPNLIDEETMKEGIKKLRESGFRIDAEKKKIGVLIGGESKFFLFTKELTIILINELIDTARGIDAQLLITTSRRTPREVEELLKERLLEERHCKILIIANEKNIEGAVAGILGLSDMVIVSGESISMVSEALSSKKPVIVFEMEEKKIKREIKQKKFLKNLSSQGYISLVKPHNIREEINKVLKNPQKGNFFEDRISLSEKVRNIIL